MTDLLLVILYATGALWLFMLTVLMASYVGAKIMEFGYQSERYRGLRLGLRELQKKGLFK